MQKSSQLALQVGMSGRLKFVHRQRQLFHSNRLVVFLAVEGCPTKNPIGPLPLAGRVNSLGTWVTHVRRHG